MENKKIALALLLTSLSCAAVNSTNENYRDDIHSKITKKCSSLVKDVHEYILNYSTQEPAVVRNKCIELAQMLEKESDHFVEPVKRKSEVQRNRFMKLQDIILNNIYQFDKNPKQALLEYSTYLIGDFLNTVNFGLDDTDKKPLLYIRERGLESFSNKADIFTDSLFH